MRIVLVGNNDGPLRLARALRNSPHRVVAIGMQKPAAPEVEEQMTTWPRLAVPDEPVLLRHLAELDFDLVVNCFANFRYRHTLRRYRCINVHLAPLPRYRGRHPLQWALIAGEETFGATVHEMSEAYDAGSILLQTTVVITPGSSAVRLRNVLLESVETRWADFLTRLEATTLSPRPNPDALATYARRRTPDDAELDAEDWADHRRLWRKVRALREDTFPAFLRFPGGKTELRDATLLPDPVGKPAPRTVLSTDRDSLCASCTDGRAVRLYTFEPHAFRVGDLIPLP